jgi:hypothetical protein
MAFGYFTYICFMKKLLPFMLLLLLGACKNTWNEDDKAAWREACTENAMKWAGSDEKAKTYCDCVLQKMMLKYPNENDALEHMGELATDTSIQNCKPKDNGTGTP